MGCPLSIVIPSYNTWWLLERCLRTLERHGTAGQQVIVVDDGSSDETRVWLAASEGIDVAFTARNRGFAGACNLGASIAAAPAILFLNADIEVLPGALAAMLAALDDPTVGIVGAKLIYPEGGIQHAGLIVDRDGKLRHAHWMRPADLPDSDRARDYPVVTGAALLIRADDFRRLGGFDERYVNGYEDAELCMRMWASGKRVRYEPRARFVHVESASPKRYARDQQNYDRFMDRWGAVLAAMPRIGPLSTSGVRLEGSFDATGAMGDEARRLLATLGIAAPEPRGASTGAFGARIFPADGDPLTLVAPADRDEAARVAAEMPKQRFLVATQRALMLMRGAGVPLENVDMWRAGIAAEERARPDEHRVVTYVSDVTAPQALRIALETWAAARETLAPLGVRFGVRAALDADAARTLLAAAIGADRSLADVEIRLLSGEVTGDAVLDDATILLVTGASDRVDRIPMLALATGVDVVALRADAPDLAALADEDAYLVAETADALPALLIAALGTGRRGRIRAAQRALSRRHSIAKAQLRISLLLHRRDEAYDDLSALEVSAASFTADRLPSDVRPLTLAV